MAIRRLRADELDREGMPVRPLSLFFWTDGFEIADGVWIAEYPDLPGYFGPGETQAAALICLAKEIGLQPVCQVSRARMPDPDTIRRTYLAIRDAGGVMAKAEGLKHFAATHKVRPSFVTKAARELRDNDKMHNNFRQMTGLEPKPLNLSDHTIKMLVEVKMGAHIFSAPYAKHGPARDRIREYLRKNEGKNSA